MCVNSLSFSHFPKVSRCFRPSQGQLKKKNYVLATVAFKVCFTEDPHLQWNVKPIRSWPLSFPPISFCFVFVLTLQMNGVWISMGKLAWKKSVNVFWFSRQNCATFKSSETSGTTVASAILKLWRSHGIHTSGHLSIPLLPEFSPVACVMPSLLSVRRTHTCTLVMLN